MDGNLATLSSANGGREPRGVCRYFSSRGECYYGPECQYLHQNPRGSSESSGALPAESKLSKYIMSENHMNHPQATSGMSNGHHGFRPTAKPILGASHHVMSRGSPSGHSHMGSQASSHSLQSGSSINGGAGVLPLLQGTGGRMSNQHVTYTQLPIPPPSYFMSEDIRVDQMRKQSLLMSVGNPEMYSDVPVQVENYHDLVPLEETPGLQSTTFGFGCSVYKAMCVKTGDAVCLRRVHDFPTPGSATRGLMATIETWKKVTHGNIVSLRHVFITKEFGDSSLIFVYDYHPGSQTLNSQYFLHSVNSNALGTPNGSGAAAPNRPWSQQPNLKLLPEPLIWSYIIQLSSGLRLIHSQNLSCRAFDPSKILMTCGLLNDPKFVTNQQLNQQLLQQPRLRLNCCGMFDVLTHESFSGHHHHTSSSSSPAATSQFQQEDLFSLGKICLALACNSSQSVKRDQWVSSLEIVARHYSSDLRTLIVTLLSVKGPQASSRTITINDIMPMIGGRFYAQLEMGYQKYDILESELYREMDASRVLRILCKLGSINERAEHRLDPQWAETGDRYLIKLLRDYMFHQVGEDGRPWMDMGHIISTINKLELASPERVCLVSRDEQNVLIVTYAELKKCFDSAFNDLIQ